MKYIRTLANPNSQQFKFWINETNEIVTIVCLVKHEDGHTEEGAVDFQEVTLNTVDHDQPFSEDGYFVFTNVPNQTASDQYRFMYKVSLDKSELSEDEFCDYSIIDVQTNAGDFVGFRARFADTSVAKISESARYRGMMGVGTNVNFKFPFASWADGICTVHAPQSQIVEGNVTFEANIIDGEASASETMWQDHFWHVHQTEAATVDADGYVNIPFKLRWNSDNSDCEKATTLKIDDVNGYTPYNRTTTAADGTGTVRGGALGMASGDEVKVKLNGNLVTNLGVLTATVN
jgi:hypothetical protein